jgi:hypothetical protein
MAHYAKIEDGVVTEVIVADEAFVKKIGGEWVQTSYNTHAGQHPDGKPMRKNFAGKGMIYDKDRDAFYMPQPKPEWVFDEDSCTWVDPNPPTMSPEELRAAAYPPVTEYIDAIVEGDQKKLDEYIAECKAVKSNIPAL